MTTDQLRSDVLNRLSQNNAFSDSRRKYLERLGTLMVGSKIRVRFANVPTASCGWRENLGYHEIRIRNSGVSAGPLDELGRKLGSNMVNTLMQEGFLYHELGHVLMSDYEAWEEVTGRGTSLKKNEMFKQWLNCTEDVVIEAWLRDKYGCGKILDVKNEIKFHCLTGVAREKDKAYKFYSQQYPDMGNTKFSFTLDLIESLGRFDGWFLEWAEDVFPDQLNKLRGPITEMISKAVKEPNARKRYEIMWDTFEDLYGDEFQSQSQDDERSGKNEMAGPQMGSESQMPTPSPDGNEESDGDDEEGDGSGSGNQETREPRDPAVILRGRDPAEVKVVK